MSESAATEENKPEGPALGSLIARVVRGDVLDADDAEAAFHTVMDGRATPVQIAALLVSLRTRGEQPSEIAGGVRALRRAMVAVAADTDGLVDTCGTGGGAFGTFNISTAAALLAAGAGIVFMFAPLLHPAMRHVAPVRRELGLGTIMNVLGPLTNPAGARRQVVGVADPNLLGLIAGGLRELGHERALVVHGQPGMDEISPIGPTDVIELKGGRLERYTVEPAALLGEVDLDPAGLAGGDPADNARVILEVLSGEVGGAARAAVVLNAAAALYVADRAASLEDGVRLAETTLDQGAGLDALERLREATRRV